MILSLSYFSAATAKKHVLILHKVSQSCAKEHPLLTQILSRKEPSLPKPLPMAIACKESHPAEQTQQTEDIPHNTLQKAAASCHHFQGDQGIFPHLEFGNLPPHLPPSMCLFQSLFLLYFSSLTEQLLLSEFFYSTFREKEYNQSS